jgi:hypothetical protein
MNICQFAVLGRFVTSGDSLDSRNQGDVLRYYRVSISTSRSIVQPYIAMGSGSFTCLNNWGAFSDAPLRSALLRFAPLKFAKLIVPLRFTPSKFAMLRLLH